MTMRVHTEALRSVVAARRIKLQALADASFLSYSMVRALVNGYRTQCSDETIKALARALEVDPALIAVDIRLTAQPELRGNKGGRNAPTNNRGSGGTG